MAVAAGPPLKSYQQKASKISFVSEAAERTSTEPAGHSRLCSPHPSQSLLQGSDFLPRLDYKQAHLFFNQLPPNNTTRWHLAHEVVAVVALVIVVVAAAVAAAVVVLVTVVAVAVPAAVAEVRLD